MTPDEKRELHRLHVKTATAILGPRLARLMAADLEASIPLDVEEEEQAQRRAQVLLEEHVVERRARYLYAEALAARAAKE